MQRLVKILLAVFSLIFYTFCMVLIDDITIENSVLKMIVHFGALLIVSGILYFIIKFILKKIKMLNKKMIYLTSVWNLGIGLIFPVVLIIAIPNEKFNIFSFMLLVSTVYYGFLVNFFLCIFNHLFTKPQK